MAESDQGDKEQQDQDQVEPPSGEVHEEGTWDRALEAGQGSTPILLEVAGPPLPEIADPSPTETAEPHDP